MVFPVVKYGCENYKESWAPKNWCFWAVMMQKTFESPLDYKKIKPVSTKGNQSWIFIGRTDAEAEAPILWPPDSKGWLIQKDPNSGKDWRQEEKGMTEGEMVKWHYWLDGHEFEQALGVGDRHRRLACPWVEKSRMWLRNWTELIKIKESLNQVENQQHLTDNKLPQGATSRRNSVPSDLPWWCWW